MLRHPSGVAETCLLAIASFFFIGFVVVLLKMASTTRDSANKKEARLTTEFGNRD